MTWLLAHLRDFSCQWTLIVGVSFSLWCAFWVRNRFGSAAASLLCFAGLSTIWVWVFTENRYLPLDTVEHHMAQALKWSSADSFGKIVAILVPMMIWSKDRLNMRMYGEIFCYFFVLLNSLWIMTSVYHGCYSGENSCGGVIGNPSIGVSLMVCTLPVFIHNWRKQWMILALAGFSVFASKSSIAAGLFAAYGALYLLPGFLKNRSILRLSSAGAFACGVLGLARAALGQQLTNDSERFHLWKFMMTRWAAPWNIPMGTGLGTYHVFSINLQQYGREMLVPWMGTKFWWNTLHNEPLQFLFECGVIGFLLFTITYLVALRKSLGIDYRIGVAVILYGLYMCLDPALHHPLPALFGAWLFTYALRKENTFKEIL